MSGAPRIDVSGLSVAYGSGPPAVSGVGFTAGANELIAVLGPNGGGKTTLFRALLGEAPRIEGTVAVDGTVASVPQTERSRLDFPVTALDVACMGLFAEVPWYRRLGRAERQRGLDALSRVGLADRADDAFGVLSGGQRQRALIARALTRAAEVLLLDEPLAGVDAPSEERILALLDELRADGKTILVATHDIEHARHCDAVLCLNRTQIAFGDPATTLLPEVLARTYGGELIELGDGGQAVVVQHHAH